MPPWLQKLLDFFLGLLGGDKQEQLGKTEQQKDDAVATEKQDAQAQKIDEDVSQLTRDQLIEQLRRERGDPPPSG